MDNRIKALKLASFACFGLMAIDLLRGDLVLAMMIGGFGVGGLLACGYLKRKTMLSAASEPAKSTEHSSDEVSRNS